MYVLIQGFLFGKLGHGSQPRFDIARTFLYPQ